jgi:hypothetical protein
MLKSSEPPAGVSTNGPDPIIRMISKWMGVGL